MLCPTTAALSRPAVSMPRTTQAAMSAMEVRAGPSLRPWPGRSGASTFSLLRAKWRAGITQTLWSMPAPWMNTTAGRPAAWTPLPVEAKAAAPSTLNLMPAPSPANRHHSVQAPQAEASRSHHSFNAAQGAGQVPNQIVRVLQADGQPNQPLADAGRL